MTTGNMYNLPDNSAQNPMPAIEAIIALRAAGAVQQHMANVEQQNNEILEEQRYTSLQMWIQTQLMSGRPMWDIQAQMDWEDEQSRIQQDSERAHSAAESHAANLFYSGLLCVVAGLLFGWYASDHFGTNTQASWLISGVTAVVLIFLLVKVNAYVTGVRQVPQA